MYTYNRKALKLQAKSMIRQGNPATWIVMLVYLLATSWVSEAADLTIGNPLNDMLLSASDLLNELTADNAALITSRIRQAFSDSFSGTMSSIALLIALIIMLYSFVVDVGVCSYCMQRMRGTDPGVGEIFSFFYIAGKIILMEILRMVMIYLWSLLFFFPGIIASYRYSMASYIIADDPNVSPLEAISRSKQLMNGRKLDLFVTDLSFIGWMILAALPANLISYFISGTVGELIYLAVYTATMMFLTGYRSLTYAGFYLNALHYQAPPVNRPGTNPFENDGSGWQN